jgi:hypothetical protein
MAGVWSPAGFPRRRFLFYVPTEKFPSATHGDKRSPVIGMRALARASPLLQNPQRSLSHSRICVVNEDCAERGFKTTELISGVERVSRAGLAQLIDGYDLVWAW